MDSNMFNQKLKVLKQKLSSINDDIVEIKKNQNKIKKKDSFVKKENPIKNFQTNNYQLGKKLIMNKNNTISHEHLLDVLSNNDVLYNNLTTPSPSQAPNITTPNKKININKIYYEKLDNIKIKKNLERDLKEENYKENLIENNNIKKKLIKNTYDYSNIINLDNELSFRQQKEDTDRPFNKLASVLSPSRNPIRLRTIRRNNPYTISNFIQEKNSKKNKLKDLFNYKFNDNITINNNKNFNNKTICITSNNNELIQKTKNPLSKNNYLKADDLNFISIISPKSKGLLSKKAIFFENKINKKKLNNLSNDYDSMKNESQIPSFRGGGVNDSKGDIYFSGKQLKVKKIINKKDDNKNLDINENMESKNKKKIFNSLTNKRRGNSLSYNKLLLNENTLINDRSNKLIKIQNKIFNINGNIKTNNTNLDKERLILKINRQLSKNNKNNSRNENNIGNKSKGKKNLAPNIFSKLNQNIAESKMMNNFILKLINLYYESTGLTINKDNDLNSTLTILYNWIENLNKKFYFENKKVCEELQYKILRDKIMNQYQLKNKNELKTFLFKLLGNDS